MGSSATGGGPGGPVGQDQQSTSLTLDIAGRFRDYPCTVEATIGSADEVRFKGKVDVKAGLADFLKKTLSPSAEGAPFPELALDSLELSYDGGALLFRLSNFEVTLPAEAPIKKLDLDFALGRLDGKKGTEGAPATSLYVAGIRAFTRERMRIAAIGDSKLIGDLLGDFGVSHLGLYYASENVTDGLKLFDDKGKGQTFAQGISFSARFGTPQSYTDIALPPPVPTGDGAEAPPTTQSGPARPEPETAGGDKRLRKWFVVQKTFGPLELRRIGGEWHEGKLGFLLDAGVELLGLKVALAGLRVSVAPARLTTLKIQDLEFGLDGLEIGFTGGPISISGAFLKTAKGFAGTALIRAPMFTIAAIGSYATTEKGDPSLFIFGAFVGIIGGPPCFVVQGIAAGFGYNRALTVPEIEKVRDFPLVSLVLSPAPGGSQNMLSQLQLTDDYFPVVPGQYWLAAGVKFTSFKLIDAFALLTVQFGARFELALLGIATMQQPPKIDGVAEAPKPFVYVELALSVRFAPDDGLFAARAVLTSNSYLFHTSCKLTGGFAFCIWFTPTNPAFENHSGDFVLTFGGYHPRFKMPAHYPQVPRIGFNWQLPDQGVTIKGECYFALTPSCIMGGCRLLATYRSGDLSVWFEAYADFLMAWEPFHYEADIGIWIGASYTLRLGELSSTISFQLGASLSIWGPAFAGEARIDLGIISFTVPIGAANQPRTVPPLEWPAFCGKFIPQIDKKPAPLSITITGGILREDKEQDLVIVNPYELSLLVDVYVPLTSVSIGEELLAHGQDKLAKEFGIRPMGERKIVSGLVVSFLDPDGEPVPMRKRPLTKGVPEALWSQEPAPDPSGKQPITAKVIANALSGARLSVPEMRPPNKATASPKVDSIAKQTTQPGLEKASYAAPVDRNKARALLREKLIGAAGVRTATVQALQACGFDLSPTAIDLETMVRCVAQTDVLLAPPAFVALGQLPPQRQES